MTDSEIRDHLSTALVAEPSLQQVGLRCGDSRGTRIVHQADGQRGDVLIEVSHGVVTLSGYVPSLSHKRMAGVIAWWVPGTRDVVNGIEVRPPEEDDDGEIADAVRIALEKDPLVDASAIAVIVRGGW